MTHRALARSFALLVFVGCATLAPAEVHAQARFSLTLGSTWPTLEERFVAARPFDVPELRLDLLEEWAAAARREHLLVVWAPSQSEHVAPFGDVTFVVGPSVLAGPSGASREGLDWFFGLGLRF